MKFTFGDGGGVLLVRDTRDNIENVNLDPNQILSSTDNRADVIMDVITDKTTSLASFFIQLFSDVISVDDDSSTEVHDNVNPKLEFGDKLGEIKAALRKGNILCDYYFQRERVRWIYNC